MRLRDRTLANPTLRAALSLASLAAWLVLLFTGRIGSMGGVGAVHLLLVASLALFPWRALRADGRGAKDADPASEDPRP